MNNIFLYSTEHCTQALVFGRYKTASNSDGCRWWRPFNSRDLLHGRRARASATRHVRCSCSGHWIWLQPRRPPRCSRELFTTIDRWRRGKSDHFIRFVSTLYLFRSKSPRCEEKGVQVVSFRENSEPRTRRWRISSVWKTLRLPKGVWRFEVVFSFLFYFFLPQNSFV